MTALNGCAQTEQIVCIAVNKFCKIIGVEDLPEAVEKTPAASVGAVGIIDGEQKPIDAHHLKSTAERRQGKVAAGGAVNVGFEVLGHRLAKLRRCVGENAARAGQRIGQTFSNMADDELQRGQPVKEAADDQAQRVKTGFSVPAPAGDGKQEAEIAGEARVIGLADRLRRRCGSSPTTVSASPTRC